jgi:hypothetical protein
MGRIMQLIPSGIHTINAEDYLIMGVLFYGCC